MAHKNKMPEQQNIEYKQSWHDDYPKWVCGFANLPAGRQAGAQSGVIFIGKDNNGSNLLPFMGVGRAPEIVLSEIFIQ